MFKNVINNLSEMISKNREEVRLYNEMLLKCQEIGKLNSIDNLVSLENNMSYKILLGMCPDLNDSSAVLIRKIIPVDEVCLTIMYGKEAKSKVGYYLVLTNKYLWLINMNGYLLYNYTDLNGKIIKNNIMSKDILLGNMLFEINGTNDSILYFLELINDMGKREEVINNELEKFCGIIPQKRYINDIGSGISLDSLGNIVFHTKNFNYKYRIEDIYNYELLIDDSVVREKISMRRVRLTSYKNSCSSMSIRVTTKDKKIFILPILEKTAAFTTVYQATSTIFRENKDFADKLFDILDELAD